jgi:hypothetical protein
MARTLLALMLLGSVVWTVLWQPQAAPPPMPSDHRALEAFVLDVAARTPPDSSIFFELPAEDADGGLANHRLRYLLGPRYVATNLDEFSPPLRRIDYVARWRNGRGTLEAAR